MTLVSSLVMVRPRPVPTVALARADARALERLKDALEIALVDADPGILDRRTRRPDSGSSTRNVTWPDIGELDGVGQKVDQDLPQPVLVGMDHRRQSFDADVAEFDALGGRLQAEHVDELIEEFGDVHLVALELEAAGFDLRDVEQPVDQSRQVLGAAAHDLDGVDPPRRNARGRAPGAANSRGSRSAACAARGSIRRRGGSWPCWPLPRPPWPSAAWRRCACAPRSRSSAGRSAGASPPRRRGGCPARARTARRRRRR